MARVGALTGVEAKLPLTCSLGLRLFFVNR